MRLSTNNHLQFPVLRRKCEIIDDSSKVEIYKEIELTDFKIDSSEINKWFLTKSLQIGFMTSASKIQTKLVVNGNILTSTSNIFFDKPSNSSVLNIFKSNVNENSAAVFEPEDILCKLLEIKLSAEESAFFPLIHSLN